jgi:hypothetical protein
VHAVAHADSAAQAILPTLRFREWAGSQPISLTSAPQQRDASTNQRTAAQPRRREEAMRHSFAPRSFTRLAGAALLPALAGIHGNGHMVMIEKNNLDIAKVIDEWVVQNVK